MKKTTTPAAAAATTPPIPLRDARIDWARGSVIGFSVPDRQSDAFEVVQLFLDGQCVVSGVANRSVFDLAKDLAGLELPSRENSAFEIKIPARGLPTGISSDSVVHLEVRTSAGDLIFDYYLAGLRDILRLTDVAPTDLLYEVRFRHLGDGSLYGTVTDRHRTGLRPQLFSVLNQNTPEPLTIYETSGDGAIHHFSIPLRLDRLVDGANVVRVASADGLPLAAYPISFGAASEASAERRLAAVEAELAFVKRMVLSQSMDALPARLTLLKGEIIGICSEMMTLQRINFEREVFGVRNDANHVHRLPLQAAADNESESGSAPTTAAVRKARAS